MKNNLAFLIIFGLCIFYQKISAKTVPYIGNPIVENCVACKFIWENIEEALVENSTSFLEVNGRRNPILAAQAFQYFCRIAPDLFFEPCNIMFEKLFFMTQDFCARKRVIDLCSDNEMCPKNI
jgi:hypothetical protein